MQTIQQYQATALGGPLILTTIPKPVPGRNDLLIRTRAVGLNPVDAKGLHEGATVNSWPTVLGLEAAGVIESVGEAVIAFQAGDDVFGFASSMSGRMESAAFQEYIVVPQEFCAKKPAALSMEEAAGLPITWSTAASAIIVGLGVPLPGLGNKTLDANRTPTSILILGGSSGCGGHAVQLLRLALGKKATIVATSSPQHHSSLKAIGANSCIPRADQGNVDALKAASPDSVGYDAVIDCVSAAAEQPQILKALRENGPNLYAEIFTGSKFKVPEGVNHKVIFGTMIFETDGGQNAFPYMAALFEHRKLRIPVKVEIVGTGYEAIGEGIERLRTGVSGTKLVVLL